MEIAHKAIRVSEPWSSEELQRLFNLRAQKIPMAEIQARYFSQRSVTALACALQRAKNHNAKSGNK